MEIFEYQPKKKHSYAWEKLLSAKKAFENSNLIETKEYLIIENLIGMDIEIINSNNDVIIIKTNTTEYVSIGFDENLLHRFIYPRSIRLRFINISLIKSENFMEIDLNNEKKYKFPFEVNNSYETYGINHFSTLFDYDQHLVKMTIKSSVIFENKLTYPLKVLFY